MADTRYTTTRQKQILDRLICEETGTVLVPTLSENMPPRYRMSPKAIGQHLIRHGYRMVDHNIYERVGVLG